jgi:hypothetical protein
MRKNKAFYPIDPSTHLCFMVTSLVPALVPVLLALVQQDLA